jgi:hypothetical protein
MDLTGYGYRRTESTTRRISSDAATSATPASTVGESTSELSAEAMRLIASLGTRVSLRELAGKYPRVLNRIAAVWHRPAEADRCFDELLLDSRRTRQGFPQSVVYEIASLRHYHVTRAFPKHVDPWEQSQLR